MPVISTINSFTDLKTSHGSNLIAPFIDNWHIDVINEASHLASCRRAVRSTHTFVDVTLNSALRRKQYFFQQTVATIHFQRIHVVLSVPISCLKL